MLLAVLLFWQLLGEIVTSVSFRWALASDPTLNPGLGQTGAATYLDNAFLLWAVRTLLNSSDPNRMDVCLQLLNDCEEGAAAKS